LRNQTEFEDVIKVSDMATVTLRDVRKSYESNDVIQSVDLGVRDREFMVFVGPSVCGKSTLLRMITGLEEISGGELTIDGAVVNDVPPDARGLAMVFQSYALYPHMSVADNMAFALRLAGVSKTVRAAKVAAAAKVLQLDPLLDRKPGQLCQEGSASASQSGALSYASPRSSCSTSRCPTSTPRCACRYAWKPRSCTASSRPR